MKNYSFQLEPTKENIYESLSNDTLGINNWINKCVNVLLNMENSIIAFDAEWGNGKTFLAKQIQMIINEKWEISSGKKNESDFEFFKNLAFSNINESSYYAIYYNAWENDNANDPICSFLFYLLKILDKKISSNKLENIGKNLIKNVINKLSLGWITLSQEGQESIFEKALSFSRAISYST